MSTLKIDRVGAQGDGVASGEKGPIYVPFTLPGERVNIAVNGNEGTAMSVLEPSPDRIDPTCKHFEHCGGCALQHWKTKPYLDWKRQILREAFASKAIETDIQPTIACEPGLRRRVTFTARKVHDKITIGFNAARSHEIVEIEECPVSMPSLIAALPALKRLATILITKKDAALDIMAIASF